MRACPDCGVAEQRTTDARGNDLVNLDPLTGRCLECLIRLSKGLPAINEEQPFDARARAARNDT